MERIHPWVDEGAEMVSRIWPIAPRVYVCPICGRGFPKEMAGQLTRDHAPPKNLGGTVIALTCRECNSDAGSVLENEANAREQLMDFAAGTSRGSLRARLESMRAIVRVEAERLGSHITMVGGPGRDHPQDHQSVERSFEEGTDPSATPLSFRLTFPPFSQKHADVAMLKAAFLVGFAKFGYSFSFHPELAPVRRQIQEPDYDVIPRFAVLVPEEKISARTILILQRPESLKSLLVQMGRHVIFLPLTGSGNDILRRDCAGDGSGRRSLGKAGAMAKPTRVRS